VSTSSEAGPGPWAEAPLRQAEFNRLAQFIHERCGIRCPPGKRAMLEARLRRRLRALHFASFAEYVAHVLGPPVDEVEVVQMINEVSTNKTDFFREAQHFPYLVDHAIPALVTRRGSNARPLSIWSAACSTGEEVYTLAMVLESQPSERRRPYSILGSDISTKVLDHARRAIYDDKLIGPIPHDLRRRFLLQSKDRQRGLVRIVPELRSKVRFARVNLLEELAVDGPFDVIFCRNVFIYFDRATQVDILHRFCARLVMGGFVFLGHSDSITGLEVPLTQVAPTIYQKTSETGGG
jgi:chemotaxis protein methyltransferase CheR